jgi:hypothetical protein
MGVEVARLTVGVGPADGTVLTVTEGEIVDSGVVVGVGGSVMVTGHSLTITNITRS